MTALDLPAIRALLEGATPGPWEEYWRGIIHAPAYPAVSICQTYGPEDQRHPNAEFIAAAPSIVAQMVAVVERVEGLHVPVIEYGEPVGCKTCDWEVSGTWPCETIRAITGEGQ